MKYLTKNKYWRLIEEYNIDKLLYLLIDRPDEINSYDDFAWQNNKHERHRDYDLPAYVWYNSIKTLDWYMKNKPFRKNAKPIRIWDPN